jgi:hypothetical protein
MRHHALVYVSCFQIRHRQKLISIFFPRRTNSDLVQLSVTDIGYYIRSRLYRSWAGVAQSVQCLATDWTTGRSRFDSRQKQRIFPLTSVSRPSLGPTQPPVQWVPGAFSPGVKRSRGVTLTTHPHLVPRSKMSRSYSSSPPKRLRGV